MAVHAEAIGLQKYLVRRALESSLLRIDKDLHGIELRLFVIMMYLTDKKWPHAFAIKHSNICSSIKTCEIDSFNIIDNLMYPSLEIVLRKLSMVTKEEDGERLSVTFTSNWKNINEL